MQPEPTELPQNASVGSSTPYHHQSTQHGLFGDPSEPSTPLLLPHGERGSVGGSSTEWSISPASELASLAGGSDRSGLSPPQYSTTPPLTELDLDSLRLSLTSASTPAGNAPTVLHRSGGSIFLNAPEGTF